MMRPYTLIARWHKGAPGGRRLSYPPDSFSLLPHRPSTSRTRPANRTADVSAMLQSPPCYFIPVYRIFQNRSLFDSKISLECGKFYAEHSPSYNGNFYFCPTALVVDGALLPKSGNGVSVFCPYCRFESLLDFPAPWA